MNKIFKALFHATKNLKVENSHRYQMSCWFATHLRKWLVLSSKIGSLELSISLTHVLSEVSKLESCWLHSYSVDLVGGTVLFWNSLHEYTFGFPLKHFWVFALLMRGECCPAWASKLDAFWSHKAISCKSTQQSLRYLHYTHIWISRRPAR